MAKVRVQRILVSLILRGAPGILLLKRAQPYSEFVTHDPTTQVGVGLWELPGGGLDFGEAPLDACVREASEETGILIGHQNLKLAACCSYTLEGAACESHRTHILFETSLNAPVNVKYSGEHLDCKWIQSAIEFQNMSMISEVREVLAALI